MASIHSVQNFSLPSRAGSRRTVTPLGRSGVPSLGPALSTAQLNRRRPRPMSTSSSAPALTTAVGDGDGSSAACQPEWIQEEGPDRGPERETRQSPDAGIVIGHATTSLRLAASGGQPPPLARSISIRWGPRLRHIPLSEVQAADDAVCDLARQRRHRLAMVLLVAVLLVGLLSCAAAVTLVAASVAVRATTTTTSALSWEAHGIAWLAASLAISAAAGIVLAVVAWRQRQQAGRDDESETGEEADATDQSREWMEMGALTSEDQLSGQLDHIVDCEEDRNWARFVEDPLRLRRYVEALEARLALTQETPEKEDTKAAREAEEAEIAATTVSAVTCSKDRILLGHTITSSCNSSSSNAVVGGLAIGGPDASSNSLLLPLAPPWPPSSPPPRLC